MMIYEVQFDMEATYTYTQEGGTCLLHRTVGKTQKSDILFTQADLF